MLTPSALPAAREQTRQILASTLRTDWSQFEPMAALRCTCGVAMPLVLGVASGWPSVGVFGAIGAVSVGFGSFQGAYRGRVAVMLWAAAGMAVSIVLGSLAGHSGVAATLVAALWGFASGLLVALGPAASFVGLQSAHRRDHRAGIHRDHVRRLPARPHRLRRRAGADAPGRHRVAASPVPGRARGRRRHLQEPGGVCGRDPVARRRRRRSRTRWWPRATRLAIRSRLHGRPTCSRSARWWTRPSGCAASLAALATQHQRLKAVGDQQRLDASAGLAQRSVVRARRDRPGGGGGRRS